MDIGAIRSGLKARLDTISDLRAHATAPASITAPAAVVAPDPATFLVRDSQGTYALSFVVTLLLKLASDTAAQDNLDAYLTTASGSIITAIESSAVALGGGADYAIVMQGRRYGVIPYAGTDYLGCELLVAVAAT